MTKQGQNGGMSAEPFCNPQEDNGTAVCVIERFKPDHIPVEGGHCREVDASYGDFTKRADLETPLSHRVSPESGTRIQASDCSCGKVLCGTAILPFAWCLFRQAFACGHFFHTRIVLLINHGQAIGHERILPHRRAQQLRARCGGPWRVARTLESRGEAA